MTDFEDYETFLPTMTADEVMTWFQQRLNRAPESYDIYKTAKDFYQIGAYSRALLCLQQYVLFPGAQVPGRHLLAYCYLNLNEKERAYREFKKCVREGYDEDWQFIVELAIEIEAKRGRRK